MSSRPYVYLPHVLWGLIPNENLQDLFSVRWSISYWLDLISLAS